MSKISLILGGARSGKSSLAEKLALKRAGEHEVLYVATLQPYDDEMRERVVKHQNSRPATWRTLEAPFYLTDNVLATRQAEKLVLIDCLTVWSSNRILEASGMLESHNSTILEDLLPEDRKKDNLDKPVPVPDKLEQALTQEIGQLIAELRRLDCGLIMVSNEVGMGLVPPYPLGRAYRDLLGRLNQQIATLCDEVLMVIAGIPVDLKRLQADLQF